MKFSRCLILGLGWFALLGSSGLAQTPAFADTIWAGTLTGKTKEVEHYQGNAKSGSVTGATANQVSMEIWFPSESTFCAVFNNGKGRASAPDGRNGITDYESDLYDIAVGENPCPANQLLTYWMGKGTVDREKKTLKGTNKTETDDQIRMSADARYVYKKTGNLEILIITGTALLPLQNLDSHGDGWMLNPGSITYSGTFTKTTRLVSVEGLKQGSLGF